MPVMIELGLLLFLVGVVISYFTRGRRLADTQAMMDRRVEAYIETIRRERSNAELSAMSDTELKDLLLSSAHNLKVQRDRQLYLLFGGVVIALIGAILVATEEGFRGFGVALVIAAIVLYGINEFVGRQIRAPLLAKGIDIERLRVE
jgi:uncharacterized protein YjiS (DUF1127 family)